MPEQHDENNDARESHAQRRLRMAEQLAEQLAAPPPPATIAAQPPAASAAPSSALLTAVRVQEKDWVQAGPPLTNDVDGPLLPVFMDSASHFRQLSLGDLLDAAIRIYRRRFRTLLGIAALLLIPMTLIELLLQSLSSNQIVAQLIQTSFVLIQSSFIVPLILAALVACAARIPNDAPHPIGAAYRAGLRRYLPLLAAGLLEGILIGIPAFLVAGCLFATVLRSSATNIATQIGLVVVLVVLILPILIRFGLISQAIVLERCDAPQGLKRSWQLTSGWFWRTFWVLFSAGLLSYLIATLPALAINFVLGLSGASSATTLAPIVTTLMSQAGVIISLPLQATISTLLYYDLRVRREGYDLEVLAQVTK